MSQALEMAPRGTDFSQYENEFSYKPVLGLAIVSIVMALVALLGLLFWALIPVAFLGMVVAGVALLQLYRSAGEYRGFGGAWFSLVVCVLAFFGGIGLQVHAYQTEVPEGFERMNFTVDISKKGFVYTRDGGMGAHPDVAALDGKKIFLKGFVYPQSQTHGLKGFLFCRDSGDCCFGGKPKPEDRIGVTMTGDKTIDFYSGRVAVAGTFRLNRNVQSENDPVYLMDGEVYTPAQSDF